MVWFRKVQSSKPINTLFLKSLGSPQGRCRSCVLREPLITTHTLQTPVPPSRTHRPLLWHIWQTAYESRTWRNQPTAARGFPDDVVTPIPPGSASPTTTTRWRKATPERELGGGKVGSAVNLEKTFHRALILILFHFLPAVFSPQHHKSPSVITHNDFSINSIQLHILNELHWYKYRNKYALNQATDLKSPLYVALKQHRLLSSPKWHSSP